MAVQCTFMLAALFDDSNYPFADKINTEYTDNAQLLHISLIKVIEKKHCIQHYYLPVPPLKLNSEPDNPMIAKTNCKTALIAFNLQICNSKLFFASLSTGEAIILRPSDWTPPNSASKSSLVVQSIEWCKDNSYFVMLFAGGVISVLGPLGQPLTLVDSESGSGYFADAFISSKIIRKPVVKCSRVRFSITRVECDNDDGKQAHSVHSHSPRLSPALKGSSDFRKAGSREHSQFGRQGFCVFKQSCIDH